VQWDCQPTLQLFNDSKPSDDLNLSSVRVQPKLCLVIAGELEEISQGGTCMR
jgi:hypothetical protein